MNSLKTVFIRISALALIYSSGLFSSGIIDSVGAKIPESRVIFKTIIEEKKEQLGDLEKESKTLKSEKEIALKTIVVDIKENDAKRRVLEQELAKEPHDEFLVKQSSLLTEVHDVLHDLVRIWEGLSKRVVERIALLDKYLKDPELKEYSKELKISSGPYFFEDLEDVHQKLMNQQKFVEQIKKRKESILKEQKTLQQGLDKATDEYKEKVVRQAEFSKAPTADTGNLKIPFGLNVQQRALLIKLETSVYKLRKDFIELQLKDKRYEMGLVEEELFLETRHLDVLQDIHRAIKDSLTVTQEQIDSALQELEHKKQAFSTLKTKYNEEIIIVRKAREDQAAALTSLAKRYGVTLGNELNTWSFEPKKTVDAYKGFCEIGALNTAVQLLDDKEAYFVALIAFEQEKITYAEGVVKVKEAYYKIISRKFASEEEITQEIKNYTALLNANEVSLKSYKTKKDEIEELLAKLQHEVTQGLKKRKTEVQKLKDTLFKGYLSDYAFCLRNLDQAEENLALRIEVVTSISKVVTESMAVLSKVASHSRFILTELESITIWYRPEHAITWEGLHNVTFDIKMFFLDVKNYYTQLKPAYLWHKVKDLFKHPGMLFIVLIKMLIAFIVLMGLRRYAGFIPALLIALGRQYVFMAPLMTLLAFIVAFVAAHAVAFLVWIIAWLIAQYGTMPDPYLYILFYLLSIPWLLVLAYRGFKMLEIFNREQGYILIRQDNVYRLLLGLKAIVYSTIALNLLRHAFILVKFPKSELPAILFALNLVIVQITLLLLVFRELINMIPLKYSWGERIYKFATSYYYVILLLIIVIFVLSNPYVGYGRLVFYLVSGVIYSIILIKILHESHLLIKRMASQLFFSNQDDVVRERFSHAKTWFGIAIIGSFIVLGIIGSLLAAKIWGWPIVWSDITRWLNQPLFGLGKGTSHPLTFVTILTFFIFIISGFIVAYSVNRFVLEKVFDLMLVDSGMQNAITSLIRYLIVAASLVLGLQSVGYGGLITYLYVLVLGIGYLFQGLLNDLIAYFIILLQRPIKVGDYIKIDDEVMGVVRKITPKSVVLRHKNSTTFVVPNVQIINKAVVNWNYARNFIGLDDIYIIVGYEENPAVVKELLAKVVDTHPKVLKNPKTIIRLNDFQEYGYQFMVRAYVSSNFTLEMHDIASDIRLLIAKTLQENSISIAVPVRQLISSGRAVEKNNKNEQ